MMTMIIIIITMVKLFYRPSHERFKKFRMTIFYTKKYVQI